MIAPLPWLFIAGTTATLHWNIVTTLTRYASNRSCSVSSINGPALNVSPQLPPTTFTSTSIRPNSASVRSTIASTWDRSRTSAVMPIARLPSACTRPATISTGAWGLLRPTVTSSGSRATTTMSAPCFSELHAARLAKSLRSAGNDRNSAGKVEIHSVPLGSRDQDVRLLRFGMSPLDGESQEA